MSSGYIHTHDHNISIFFSSCLLLSPLAQRDSRITTRTGVSGNPSLSFIEVSWLVLQLVSPSHIQTVSLIRRQNHFHNLKQIKDTFLKP